MSRSFTYRLRPLHKVRQANYGRVVRRPRFETFEDRRMLSFTPAFNYATVGTPSALVTADFNKDGNLDLATCANAGEGSISVLLGNGAGGFGAALRTVIGSQLTSMAVADFNSDGTLDIVASDTGNNVLQLLKGNGDGTFQQAVSWEQWGYLSEAATGDFNNDGKADLLVRVWEWDSFNDGFHVRLGDGIGGFGSSYYDPITWDTNAPYQGFGLATVDLNRDGKLDMVTADVDAYLGDGNGTLQAGIYSPAIGRAVATGDFTGDGNVDAISVGNGLAVLRGKGDGTFHPAILHTANGANHTAVATADFNADGKLDAIVTDSDLGTASVMLGNGDGTLRFFSAFATGTSPSGVVVGDFNGDGRPDAAVSNAGYQSRNVSILLNDGNWQTPPPPPPAPPDLSISDATVTEGNTGTRNATFTLTLSKPATVEAVVNFNAAGITAVAGSDFDYTSGYVIFAAGETSKAVTVAVKGDRVAELNETFALNLFSPTNLRIADAQGIATIVDDEPRISINDVSGSEGNAGNTMFTFTVQLSTAYDQAVTVNYATANGTATSGSDYLAKSGSVTFLPGQTIKTITVTVKGDKQSEANETFFMNLSGMSNASITDSQGLGTILNDDNGGPKGNGNSFALAADAAIDDWTISAQIRRAR